MSHIIIGLCGHKRHGKSMVAKYLCEKHGFTEIAAAEPLKKIIGKQLFYFTEDQLYGKKKDEIDERWGTTPRQVFIQTGKFLRESFGDDFFSKRVMFRILELTTRFPKGTRIVVSDCRFPTELDVIEKVGGYTCRVVMPNAPLEDDDTETAIDGASTHFTISNIKDKQKDTEKLVDKMMERIESAFS